MEEQRKRSVCTQWKIMQLRKERDPDICNNTQPVLIKTSSPGRVVLPDFLGPMCRLFYNLFTQTFILEKKRVWHR